MENNSFLCPECGSNELNLFDTSPDKSNGWYHCLNCGRQTTWRKGESHTIDQVLDKMNKMLTDLELAIKPENCKIPEKMKKSISAAVDSIEKDIKKEIKKCKIF